jgi:hypothetical protein
MFVRHKMYLTIKFFVHKGTKKRRGPKHRLWRIFRIPSLFIKELIALLDFLIKKAERNMEAFAVFVAY